jgi:uncharacterized protein (DUF1778 family)
VDTLRELFTSLAERRRPEDVAELVRQQLDGRLDRNEQRLLDRAAKARSGGRR